MRKTVMIKRRYEFKRLFSKGKFFLGKSINMYLIENKKDYNKLAVAVSKKQGKAVVRNRFKRLIKENYRELEKNLKVGYNMLFIVNRAKMLDTKQIDYYDIKEDMVKIFQNCGIWNEENID